MEQKSIMTNGLWTSQLSINGLFNGIVFEEFVSTNSVPLDTLKKKKTVDCLRLFK